MLQSFNRIFFSTVWLINATYLPQAMDPLGAFIRNEFTGFHPVNPVYPVKNIFFKSFSRSDGYPSPDRSSGLCLRGSSEQSERVARTLEV